MPDTNELTYRLKTIPYGPAGIELSPKRWKRTILAEQIRVERTDETRMNDWGIPVSCVEYQMARHALRISGIQMIWSELDSRGMHLPLDAYADIVEQQFPEEQFRRIGENERMDC
jgi:hypothetical protein